MVGHGAKFDSKKDLAITALLSHRNVEEAASAAGISTHTLLRWMKEPEFEADLREARRKVRELAVGRLQDAAGAAVNTLLRTMLDPDAPPGIRLKAAELVLTLGAKNAEVGDLAARMARLERAIGKTHGAHVALETVTWPEQKALPGPATVGGGDDGD